MTSKVIYEGNLSTRCTHVKSGTEMITDAPVDNNGNGNAFSPTDLLATSLASCMLTVMGIKAAASNILFEQVHAKVWKKMNSNPRSVSEISVDIQVAENWTEKEKAIMENTAKNCPVAHSLHPELKQSIKFIYSI